MRTVLFTAILSVFLFSCAKKAGEAKFVLEISDLDKTTSMEDCSKLINKRLEELLDKSRPDIKTEFVNNQLNISFDYCEEDTATVLKVKQLLISQKSELQFWETFDNIKLNPFWQIANDKVRETFGDSALAEMNKKPEQQGKNGLGTEIAENERRIRDSIGRLYPISRLLYPRMDAKGYLLPGPVIGYCSYKDTAQLMLFLTHPNVKKFFPRDAIFAFSSKGLEESDGTFEVYCLKKTGNGPAISGNCIERAAQGGKKGEPMFVDLQFNEESAKKWERLTERLAASKENDGSGNEYYCAVAIVMENKVLTAPGVANKISGGRSEISGGFSNAEVHEIVAKILYPMNFSSRVLSYELIPATK
ncbi:MAG: hypothetical protein IAF38_14105 [Bacteroidia bacterium]|nr:hypothetical protein [Bacteroidia bacterium]